MHLKLIFLFFAIIPVLAKSQPKQYYKQKNTYSYYEMIEEYRNMDKRFEKAKLLEYGKTDSGKPLHLFVISSSGKFSVEDAGKEGKLIFFINNGIHPGEPEGIDASIEFSWKLLTDEAFAKPILDSMVICIVPCYNIGGMLNRSPFHRANQTEPVASGFRGNARNIDLNRDYMICQTENARSLTQMLREWNPDVFLETHATNGSDHQNHMTLIATAHQDLPKPMGDYLDKTMRPALYKAMEKQSRFFMCPYVSVYNKPPDAGFEQLLESPRFSTGYASLFNSFAFMTENHIYFPYAERVESCLDFMHCLTEYSRSQKAEILHCRKLATAWEQNQQWVALNWNLDTTRFEWLYFHGYEAVVKPSQISGLDMLYYDRNKPFAKNIKYFNEYVPVDSIKIPEAYVIPQAWSEAVERLRLNNITLVPLEKDSVIELEMYYITGYQTYQRPQNGHYTHYEIQTSSKKMKIQFYEGDYIIPVKGNSVQYLTQALEPKATDSYFAWNLFDEILQTREYFSPFRFEDRALQILDTTPGLKEELLKKVSENTEFKNNSYLQMRFVYEHSPFYEKTYLRFPVGRIME